MAENYMDELMAWLDANMGAIDEEQRARVLERIKAELIRSFKNGLARGRDLSGGEGAKPRKQWRRRDA